MSDIHPTPVEFTESQVASDPILRYFHHAHIVSKPFCELAKKLISDLPRSPERTVALRKLLEAKDSAVRASTE